MCSLPIKTLTRQISSGKRGLKLTDEFAFDETLRVLIDRMVSSDWEDLKIICANSFMSQARGSLFFGACARLFAFTQFRLADMRDIFATMILPAGHYEGFVYSFPENSSSARTESSNPIVKQEIANANLHDRRGSGQHKQRRNDAVKWSDSEFT
jgi:hypothetical protein